ncbi:GNAT family N-acetyltransferase [Psychrobacter sp.]|uniref:GNAT family N-acetyltransferase n=1 Tax=Psychrobacter sp. TaxID=56811 RepID=UPI0025EE6DC3|nr:GNAT family N-acetyltransferase [Psychrobacter sp.]
MIKKAQLSEAAQIADLIRASIRSCIEDHNNDPHAIEQWLENKTEENVRQWIIENFAWVFKQQNEVQGIILVSPKAEILLNYVAPKSQGQGIGRKLLNQTKQVYLQKGIGSLTAESTLTARPFYLANGFKVVEEVFEAGKLVAYKMSLTLEQHK